MKTEPMAHQTTGAALLAAHRDYYALGCEQGTGKTWMLLADAERQYREGAVSGVLVIAPNGVHVNWIEREIPKHLEVPHVASYWRSGAGKKHARALDKLLAYDGGALVIVAINIDSINTKSGYDYARRFLLTRDSILIVDESQKIKNPAAKRTHRILALAEHAVSRRISSGTIVSNAPTDVFSQFEFLRPGLLGTRSYRAFVAEYSELLPPGSGLVEHIRKNAKRGGNPQIVKRDKNGNPVYKNLDKLHALIAPHMYRVTKDEALDLPQKIYQTHFFHLEPQQQSLYNQVKADMRYHRPDGDVDTLTALTLIGKLRQITSGFIMVDGEPTELSRAAARISALKDILGYVEWPVIIWGTYREELRQIADEVAEMGVVEYHGGIGAKDRESAIDAFQSGAAQAFIANPATAGTGLTLTAAKTVIYYSNSYSLNDREQSEDRAHRKGLRHPVVYIDLVASGTIDERIAAALQSKAGVAARILGDELES